MDVIRASSDDAWAEFGKDVKAKMEQAVKANFITYKVTVHPHGTESSAVAAASGTSKYDQKPLTIVGIYDKKTKELEMVEFEGKKFGP
ncbi:MAG: hypothetical protein ABIR71_08160 [Chthoniobacterales bacterium]